MSYILLSFFAVLNISLLFYVRWLLSSIKTMNEQIDSIWNTVGVFTSHLKGVYELETFYGDETLEALLKHSSMLLSEIESFDRLIEEEFEENPEEDPIAEDAT